MQHPTSTLDDIPRNCPTVSEIVCVSPDKVRYFDEPLGKGAFAIVTPGLLNLNGNTIPVAVKELFQNHQHSGLQNKKDLISAQADFKEEERILRRISHENIVRLHAVMNAGPNGSRVLLLDLLNEALSERIQRWRQERSWNFHYHHAGAALVVPPRGNHLLSIVHTAILPLARAIAYLHHQGIIHGDIKPSNVGFDSEGILKLFDFGLSKQVNGPQQGFIRAMISGTPRYMAPETRIHGALSFHSDVYLFGLVLFEVYTLKKPFQGISSIDEFQEIVVLGRYRPSLRSMKSHTLKLLIQRCWDANPEKRPSIDHVVDMLERWVFRKNVMCIRS